MMVGHAASNAERVGRSSEAKAQVLTKAVLRAQGLLGITQQELAPMLGVSAATISRIRQGRLLETQGKEFELGALFVRMFRSLDALVGGNPQKARAWIREHNQHLEGVPIEMMKQIVGAVRVVEYLDAMRGQI